MESVQEPCVGDVRFNKEGNLEQLCEFKDYDGGQLIAVEARWVIVPMVE